MKRSTTSRNQIKAARLVRAAWTLAFWLAVWFSAAHFVDKEVLLPSPLSVGRVLLSLLLSSSYWLSIAASLIRVLIGYLLGCVIAVVVSVICFRSMVADALLSPVLSVIRAVPVASFIILALVWLGRARVPSFSAFLMVLPIISGNILTGLRAADKELWEVCKLYRFKWTKTVRLLYLPAVRPYFLSAARTSLGLAWKAGIAAEVLCSLSASIGGQIYESKVYLETPALFAWTITVICISMLIESILFRVPVFRGESLKKREEK